MKNFALHLFVSLMISLYFFNCKNDPVSSNIPESHDNDDPSVMTDIEGHEYNYIKIGTQFWTVEDLRTTKYNDGTAIPRVSDDTDWVYSTTGAYCSYKNDNNTDTIQKYGLLYNWYAVNTGKLAPKGWHVPDTVEWNTLRDYLITNGYNWDGTLTKDKVAKSLASQTDWESCDTIGTIGNDPSSNNKSGFTALPDGSRYANGVFGNKGLMSHWWTSTPAPASRVYSIFLSYKRQTMTLQNQQKTKGFAVRIIRND